MIKIFHINAFTNALFTGNPAAVCVLDKWLPDDLLFSIAQEKFTRDSVYTETK